MKCPNCNSEITLNSKSRVKLYGLAVLILFCISISGFLFYWYEWRPSQIRKECAVLALEKIKTKNDANWNVDEHIRVKELYYKQFLRERGLEK